MPPSALNKLTNHKLPYPLIFCISKAFEEPRKKAYVGVLEFVAPETMCYVPDWIFENLCCFEGNQVSVELVPEITVNKGKLIKI